MDSRNHHRCRWWAEQGRLNLEVIPFYGRLGTNYLRRMREMSGPHEELTSAAQAVSPELVSSSNSDVEFGRDLAFPRLSDEMLRRLREEANPQCLCDDRSGAKLRLGVRRRQAR